MMPSGAPLRDPTTGAIIGNTPFMDSFDFHYYAVLLLSGIGYGIGAEQFKAAPTSSKVSIKHMPVWRDCCSCS